MKSLNEKEIERFTKKYLPEWIGDINSVSLLKYHGTKEYLVNEHFLVIIKRFKETHIDLQELLYK